MTVLETTIRASEWWRSAAETPDRHYPRDAGVSLADHLERVSENVSRLTDDRNPPSWLAGLQSCLVTAGLSLAETRWLLEPVALLHDIGKPQEEKRTDVPHPITGAPVKKRHPIVGVMAALALIPEDTKGRSTMLSLIAEHDTPFGWYRQAQRRGELPSPKSWARLDAKICGARDGRGILLLATFKLADIDGHTHVDDVPWFIDHSNDRYLAALGLDIPVPTSDEVRSIGV